MINNAFFRFETLQFNKASSRSAITLLSFCLFCFCCVMACTTKEETILEEVESASLVEEQAAITAVTCTGQANNYTLNVTIKSPDTGCDQYADWWEVFTEDGDLIYRRILGHSHVDEQPFTRSGGVVNVGPDDFIYVRGHMNNLGYGSLVFSGTLRNDLMADTLATDFAIELETTEPLPTTCAF